MPKGYDYIVVGAGSAGCVVANRLSADPSIKVLLIEAGGPDRHPLLAMPLACGKVFYDPAFGWDFKTEPEPYADNRVLHRGAGKVLGGSSSVNGMMYNRGHPRDYDQWAQMGCTGWSYDEVLPYFRRAERNWRGETPEHGGDGPLSVARHVTDDLYAAIAETARRKGLPVSEDFSRGPAEGFGVPDFTIHKGRRASTARRYIHTAMSRPNLTVEMHAETSRILFERHCAVGVEYRRNGVMHKVYAEREVILSGGAYNSPKLLMLSGIGAADELAALGITPFHDLPGVGRNLQEHPGAQITYRTTSDQPFDSETRLDRITLSVLRWAMTGGGTMSRLPFTAMAFCRTRPELERPDIELLFTPAALDARIWFPGWRSARGRALGISTWLLRPASRGWVKLRSSNPADPPRILLNLLAEREDRAKLLAGLKMVREFMASEPASSLVSEELDPGPGASDDEAIAAHIRKVIRTMQHPTSSCTMGLGRDAVVDPQLRVRGIDGLRVIDASIMPIVVGGHTNAPTIMIGEKGADLVLGRSVAPADIRDAA